jgi:hypothetical protein
MAVSATPPASGEKSGVLRRVERSRLLTGKTLGALLVVLFLVGAVAIVWVSALQAQVPRNMPFGVTGRSLVVKLADKKKVSGYKTSFDNITYPNETAAMNAINQGTLYGAYITGPSSDTLVISQAKSFFAYTEIRPLFTAAAKLLRRPLSVKVAKPLPAGKDPIGAVTGTLLLATVIGGMVAAIMIFSLTHEAVQRWRGVILVGITLLGALLTDVIAGPLFGAFAGNRFWPLLPCLWLSTLSTALVGAALIAILPAIVAIVVIELVFIVLGMVTAGAGGVALLPRYWQSVGAALPPRYGANLFHNVLYFSSNNITIPIVVLVGYGLIATAVLFYVEWIRRRTAAARGAQHGAGARSTAGPRLGRVLIVVTVIAVVYQGAFATSYISAGHNPVADNMPFAGIRSSSLTSAVEQTGAIKVTDYRDRKAAQAAIGQATAWGALIPHAGVSRLLTVPSISDLAPYTLPLAFKQAAASQGQTVVPTPYTPTPLASGDPFGLVLAILLTPVLLFGYQVVTVLKMATKVTAGPLLGVTLVGFSIVATLLIDLIAGPWLGGIPGSKFWILWPIMALGMSVVALIAAVLGRLLGALGTLLTVFVIILLGKPSSGGANGVPYLPAFWSTIGPYLPPRNLFILMRNTVYFGGNGTTQALIILLAYLVVFGVTLVILDWYRRPAPEIAEVPPEREAMTAAVAIPASAAP